jgi:exodeoxyribonuclease-3
MRFLTWNIQSGGGKRIPSMIDELEQLKPDLVALTEVTFAHLAALRSALSRLGLSHIETTCAEGRTNSVLVASRLPISVMRESITHDQERWLLVSIEALGLKVLCVHVPGATDNKFTNGYGISGKKRKELFWDQVVTYATQHKDEDVVLLGDFNTGLEEDAQGTPFELSNYIRVLRLEKYVDAWRHLHPGKREYTWYSKRKNNKTAVSDDYNGFRLDYVFVSNSLRDSVIDARHVDHVRRAKISDHAIIVADVAISAEATPRSDDPYLGGRDYADQSIEPPNSTVHRRFKGNEPMRFAIEPGTLPDMRCGVNGDEFVQSLRPTYFTAEWKRGELAEVRIWGPRVLKDNTVGARMLDHVWHDVNGSGPVTLSALPAAVVTRLRSYASESGLTLPAN